MTIVKDLDQTYVDHHLCCPEGKARIEIVDPQRTNLYIEVRTSNPGEGTYYFRYKEGRNTRHVKIGRTREMTLEKARKAALQLKAERAKGEARMLQESEPEAASSAQAIDLPHPQTAAKPIDVAVTSEVGITLDRFWTDHYLPHAKTHKRSWWRDAQLYQRIKPKFGHLPLAGIKRLAVEQFQNSLLVEEKLAKATANQHAVLLRRVLNLAVQWEMLGRNVLTRIQLFDPENQVDGHLDDAQVNKLVQVLKTDKNRRVCLILLFLLSTGARRSEGLKAEWKQIDLEKRSWRIPSTNSKSKKPKSLPLNDSAMWVLGQLSTKETSPYVFPSPATGKPFTEITRVWYRIRKQAGVPDARIHDLRHTFASRVVSGGGTLFEVQKLLGHADPRMSLRYAYLSMDAMQKASSVAALNLE